MPMPVAVMGAISLIFWSLIIVVTGKYVCFVLQAHNRGEGGVARARRACAPLARSAALAEDADLRVAAVLGLVAVLRRSAADAGDHGALRGRRLAGRGARVRAARFFRSASCILFGLFAIQSRGTGKIGRMFGPDHPRLVPRHRHPRPALHHRDAGDPVGAQSGLRHRAVRHRSACRVRRAGLDRADRHGRPKRCLPTSAISAPSRSGSAWLYVVLPGLVLNYFGQGAAILQRSRQSGRTRSSSCAAGGLHYPMVVLATLAVDHREPGGDHRRCSRSPTRRCSSGSCRGWKFATPRRPSSGRSTCRAPTRCCWSA